MPLKNSKFRSVKDNVTMTEDNIKEYIKCSQDIVYFANNYFYNVIKDKDGSQNFGLISLHEFQKRMLKTIVGDDLKPVNQWDPRRNIVGMASRGSGKSTIAMLYFLWYFIFNENKRLAILSKDLPSAERVFSFFRTGYENLPSWMQPAVTRITHSNLEAANNCTIECLATTENAGRSGGFIRIFLDEFAVILPQIQEKFFEAIYPILTRHADSKMIIFSTPKGVNKFHEIFMDAKNGLNSFKPIQVNWWEWPGRDQAWKEEQMRTMGAMMFNQEYANKFLGSSQTLIEGEFIYRMEYKKPIREEMDGKLLIYEEIDPNALYVLGGDSSTGTGNDPSVVQVIRIDDVNDIRQVATFADSYCPPPKFAEVCVAISKMFNECDMIIEANSPGCGEETCRHIWYDLQYDKLLNTDASGKLGTNPNVKSKLKACLLLKTLIESGCLSVVDHETIEQLATFEEHKENRFAAAKGKHDDRVTSLYWACYYLVTPFSDFDTNLIRFKLNEQYQQLNDGEDLPNMNKMERAGADWWGDGMARKIPEGVTVPKEFENSFISMDEILKNAEMDLGEWGAGMFEESNMYANEVLGINIANNQNRKPDRILDLW